MRCQYLVYFNQCGKWLSTISRLNWPSWPNLTMMGTWPYPHHVPTLCRHDLFRRTSIATLGWLPAQKLVTYWDLCLLHKILMTGQSNSLSQYLQMNRGRTARDTRTANHLSLLRVRNNHGKRVFIYRSVPMYVHATNMSSPRELTDFHCENSKNTWNSLICNEVVRKVQCHFLLCIYNDRVFTVYLVFVFNPRPAGVWLVTRPAGGGGGKGKGWDFPNYWTDFQISNAIR